MHRSMAELEARLDEILAAPFDSGPVEMIVRRPAENQREVVVSAKLDPEMGLVGDDWRTRVDPAAVDSGSARLTQLTLMNARVAEAVAVTRERWPLAGDQLYVDMDLSVNNLPPGAKVRIGDAVVEISPQPHTGCSKFSGRFGREALRFANVGVGRENRFRGMYGFVVEAGEVSVGDEVTKL